MLDWLTTLTPPEALSPAALTAYVLFDIFLIVVLARLLGNLLAGFGQPRVVGEILAGVMLGPTLLGPQLSQLLAPMPARPVLGIIGSIGLVLFMFLAGTEYDSSRLRGRELQAGVLAFLAVGLPALLGFPIAALMQSPEYAGPAGEDPVVLGLFIGAALAVTAFPVMAHILMERNELNTPLGSLGVACAGFISVFMFTYIAFASSVAAGKPLSQFLFRLLLIVLFSIVSLVLVKPLLGRMLSRVTGGGALNPNAMALIFAGMTLYALLAHLLGIHALTGGFIWGFLLPDDSALRKDIASRVRDLALVFFLPVFFAQAGFAANLRLLQLDTLPVLLIFLGAAVLGKFASAVPAYWFKLSWGKVLSLGALFNTRGLLVLVVGLLGMEYKIITSLTFTLIVVTALVTNLMTLPVLNAVLQTEKLRALEEKTAG